MMRLWSLVIRLIVHTFLVVKVDARLEMTEDRWMLQVIRVDGIMNHVALFHVAQVTVKSMTV